MKKCFVYNYYKEVQVESRGPQMQNHLVIFFAYKEVLQNKTDIQLQLRSYFFNHTLPDRLILLSLDYNKHDVIELFQEGSDIYEYIPKFEYKTELSNLRIVSLDITGNFTTVLGMEIPEEEMTEVYNRGLTKIFVDNGGLIISRSAHHFVFPSGKHCDRFLRTGNVLLHGAQITFIASALLAHFKTRQADHIYCDTSSINSLAYAYINLRQELGEHRITSVHVESFGSYQLFESNTFNAKRGSIFLISSSTSGSILKRMTSDQYKGKNIELSDLAVIYGLGVEAQYTPQVICDLTIDPKRNPDGVDTFTSYNVKNGKSCALCADNSKPLTVEGDVFLLEKPTVTAHLIGKAHLPSFMRSFENYYRPNRTQRSVIRCFHKENGKEDRKYELYIDVEQLADSWMAEEIGTRTYIRAYEKFEKNVLQSFPASLKYIIALQDTASQKVARLIVGILVNNGFAIDDSIIVNINEIETKIQKGQKGVVAVVSSSIVTGRNLLFLSRALRDFEQDYQRMYFTFINRTNKSEFFDFLESNLGLGENGKGTHKITNVEKIYCSLESMKSAWHEELEFMKKLEEFCDSKDDFPLTLKLSKLRQKTLNESGLSRGLDDQLFLPSLYDQPLKINNGFAFAPARKDFSATASQSEVYFIIANILNDLRNKNILGQSEYVRNLLDPGNFVRYNDGIIQACLLRSATYNELKFHLSDELSLQMKAIIGDMIIHLADNHSEAIIEFFYAIAIKKLRLPDRDVQDCISLLEQQVAYTQKDTILKGIVEYIKENYFGPTPIYQVFRDLEIPKVPDDAAFLAENASN